MSSGDNNSLARRLENLRPWKPGQSGNPLGRRSDKSLVDHVLRETKGGAELGTILLDIARHGRREKDRIEAAEVLLDRCFGKVPSTDRPSLFGALNGSGELHFGGIFGKWHVRGDENDDSGDAADSVIEIESEPAEASELAQIAQSAEAAG